MSAAPAVSISIGWWADDDRRAPSRDDDRAGGRGSGLHSGSRAARGGECSISPPVSSYLSPPVPLAVLSASGPYLLSGRYVVVDMTGAWVILCTAIVYLLASIYSIGYMRLLGEDERLWGFYALFSGFALTILVSSVMNNAGTLLDSDRAHDARRAPSWSASSARPRASRRRGNTSSSYPPGSASRCSAPSCSTGAAASCSGRPTT